MAANSSVSSGNNSKKRALIIGNCNYKKGRVLRFSADNARDISDKLSNVSFQTTLILDLLCDQIDNMIEEFVRTIVPSDLIVVFYSGYAINNDEQNYLLPIDDQKISSLSVLPHQTLNLAELSEAIVARSPSAVIFILDACRHYTLSDIPGMKSQQNFGGFSTIKPQDNTLFILPCEIKQTVADISNDGRNTRFISRLLRYMEQSNLSINDLLEMVNKDITYDNTDETSIFKVSALKRNVYLNYQIQSAEKYKLPPQVEQRIAQAPMNSMIDLRQEQLTDRDIEIIVQQAIIQKQCTRLWLASNKITAAGAACLANALVDNKHLERLFLFGNPLGEKGIKFLMTSLATDNKNLKILNLQETSINDSSIEYIIEMLKTNKTLLSLSLGKNDISDSGLKSILDTLLNYNSTLQYLDVSCHRRITNESVEVLENFIRNRKYLNELCMYDCHISPTIKENLAKLAKTKPNFSIYLKSWNE